MTEEVTPVTITLTLNVQQVNAIVAGLGELKTNADVWPLKQWIIQEATKQLPPPEEVSESESSEE